VTSRGHPYAEFQRVIVFSLGRGGLGGALLFAIFAAIVLALVTGQSHASSSRVGAEGVSSLSYAPKPFYDDLSRMRARFTTTGRASRASSPG
jgi:hypothetical protein